MRGFTPFQIGNASTNRISKKKRFLFGTGFTLIELMIVILIFSIILGAIFAVMTMGNKAWQSGNVQIEIQQETRKGMDSMLKELRQSNLGRITVTANTVTFQIPQSVNNSGNITWCEDILYSLGGLNGEQLLRTQGEESRVLANNVQGLQFSATKEEINITLVAEKETVSQHTLTATLSSSVTLRN